MKKVALICLLFAVGCSSKVKKEEVLVEEEKIELPKIVVSDKGPLFELAPDGPLNKTEVKEKATGLEVYKTKTHTFLKVILPDGVTNRDPAGLKIRVPEIASHFSGGFRKDAVYLRVVGSAPVPETFSVVAEDPIYQLRLDVSMKAKRGKKAIEKEYYLAMRPPLYRRDSPYATFVSERFLQLSGASKKDIGRRVVRPPRSTELKRVMNLYSGATSIRETFQNDRQLRVAKTEAQTVDVKTIAVPKLAQHPWEKMISSLKSETSIEPMASYIPADKGYAHFHDLRTFVKIAKELDELSPMIQSLEGDGGTREFADYYEKQLVLERTGVAEILGHKAAKSVAIVMGDSFVREGTDVAILFRVENKLLLETALNKFEASARSQHLKMNQFSVKVADVDVRRIYTDDLSVNQFRASYGDVLILANSLELVTDLVNTYKKKNPSLKDEGDFRYMRTKYPFSKDNEAGFVFLSDAFIAKVISPQTRIASARRFQRESDLLAVNYGVMLHAKLEGTLPADLKALSDSGIMSKSEFMHQDGSPISYTPSKGAFSKYGSARMMRPLSAFPVQLVSVSEAEAYKEFQTTYQSYWRKFIDPIAVQIQFEDEGKSMSAEVRILPIIDSSDYDKLIELVGEASAPRYKKVNDGIEWTFAIGKDAKLRDELSASSKSMAGLSVSWLGNWMQIGAADHSRFWDLVVAGLNLPLKSTETGEPANSGSRGLIRVVQEMPFHVAVEIANELVFAAMLTDVKSKADKAAPGMVTWEPLTEGYRDQYIVSISGKDNFIGEFRIYYSIVNGIFVLSSRLDYLKSQIDKFLTDPEMTAGQSHIGVALAEDSWLGKASTAFLHNQVFPEGHANAMDMIEETLFSGKYDAAQTLHFRGELPRSPFEGRVVIEEGVPVLEYEGTKKLKKGEFLEMNSSLSKQIKQTKSIEASVAFDGKENHRSLLIKLDWKK